MAKGARKMDEYFDKAAREKPRPDIVELMARLQNRQLSEVVSYILGLLKEESEARTILQKRVETRTAQLSEETQQLGIAVHKAIDPVFTDFEGRLNTHINFLRDIYSRLDEVEGRVKTLGEYSEIRSNYFATHEERLGNLERQGTYGKLDAEQFKQFGDRIDQEKERILRFQGYYNKWRNDEAEPRFKASEARLSNAEAEIEGLKEIVGNLIKEPRGRYVSANPDPAACGCTATNFCHYASNLFSGMLGRAMSYDGLKDFPQFMEASKTFWDHYARFYNG
jgi:hypothetical protein